MTSATDDFDEEYDDYDDFDEDERGVSGLVVLLIILAMLLAFSLIVWLAYNKGVRQGTTADGEVPYVAADPEPVKEVADAGNAAGLEDREVYDRFDGNARERTEVMTKGPEEPIKTESVDQIAVLAAQAEAELGDSVDSETQGINADADRARDAVERARAESAERALVPEPLTPTGDETAGDEPAAASQGAVAPTRAAATPSVKPASRPTSGSTPTTAATASTTSTLGSHVVQVGAFRSAGEADAFWGQLGNRFGDYLDGKSKDVERADLGAKGIFYRLRIAGFDSADAANQYCSGLKARRQDCLVKKR